MAFRVRPGQTTGSNPYVPPFNPNMANSWSGSADSLERYAELEKYGVHVGGMTPMQRNQWRAYNNMAPRETVPDFDPAGVLAQLIQRMGSGGSSGGSSAAAAQEALRKQQIEAYQRYLSGGGPEQGVAGLRDSLASMIAAGRGDIEDVYGRTMGNIGEGYGAAEGLTRQGYEQLASFLAANPNNPYAGFGAEAGAVSNPLEQVLGAYGVDAPEAQAMMAAEQAAGQSGAANFNSLVDVLSRSAQLGATSRASESEMARNFAMTSLGQQRGMYESQAAASRQQALAQLAQMQAQREFEIQQTVNSIRQGIINELLGIGGRVPGSNVATAGGDVPQFVPQAGDNPMVYAV